jgi:mRNA interferase MazF
MSSSLPFIRGDVVLATLPFLTDPSTEKVRPAVVIQNDVGNRFSPNLIVAAISSQPPRREYPTNLILRLGTDEARGAGLDLDSVVQAEVIAIIPKQAVSRLLGRLNPLAMRAVDSCIRISLGLS